MTDAWEAALVPRDWGSGPNPKALRQGDVAVTYVAQLRTNRDPAGPSAGEVASPKVPLMSEFDDRMVDLPGAHLTVRVWRTWVMLVEQSCELDHKDRNDSRLLAAPIVFRDKWDGPFWRTIISGQSPGYIGLPALDEQSSQKYSGGAWPAGVDAAVCLAGMSLIAPSLFPRATFSVIGKMRAVIQHRLVSFWSVRDWKRANQRDELVGMRIAEVYETYEQHVGPGRLHKVHLEQDNDDDDEVTVGLVFNPS